MHITFWTSLTCIRSSLSALYEVHDGVDGDRRLFPAVNRITAPLLVRSFTYGIALVVFRRQ